MKQLEIGNVRLKNNLILGPMAGIGCGSCMYGNGECERDFISK